MTNQTAVDPWLMENLVCPRDYQPLRHGDGVLTCPSNHAYPVVDGVPIMLVKEAVHSIPFVEGTWRRAVDDAADQRAPELYLESLGISEDEKQGVIELAKQKSPVDPVVAFLVAATNGLMYRHLIGRLERYPIPDSTLPAGDGRMLLDVGCSWGRWTLAAHACGYRAAGIDPSLGAIMAARRVARQLNVPAHYVVGDARHLPFPRERFDCAHSYSVLQHLDRADAARSVAEVGRVLKPGGSALIQMPTRYGLRCAYHQWRRGFREGTGFEVRYWSLPELKRVFTERIGSTTFTIDGFFGIGLQSSDESLMPPARKLVLKASAALKWISRGIPALTWAADSVFVRSVKAGTS